MERPPHSNVASNYAKKANLSDVEQRSDEGNGPDNQFYSVNGMPFGYVEKTRSI